MEAKMPYKDQNSEAAKASRRRKWQRTNEKRKEWTRQHPRKKSVPMEVQRETRKVYQREWAKKSSSKRKLASAQLKYRHGKTIDEVEELVRAQNNLCLLCKKPLDLENSLSANGPAIDHKHNAGCCEVGRSCDKCRRGIVHRACNSGLGMFEDDPVRLRLAAEYLEKYIEQQF